MSLASSPPSPCVPCTAMGCGRSYSTQSNMLAHLHQAHQPDVAAATTAEATAVAPSSAMPPASAPPALSSTLHKRKQSSSSSSSLPSSQLPCPYWGCTRSYTSQRFLDQHFKSIHLHIPAALTAPSLAPPPLSHDNSLDKLMATLLPPSPPHPLPSGEPLAIDKEEEREVALTRRVYINDLAIPVKLLPTIQDVEALALAESEEAMANDRDHQTLLALVAVRVLTHMLQCAVVRMRMRWCACVCGGACAVVRVRVRVRWCVGACTWVHVIGINSPIYLCTGIWRTKGQEGGSSACASAVQQHVMWHHVSTIYSLSFCEHEFTGPHSSSADGVPPAPSHRKKDPLG